MNYIYFPNGPSVGKTQISVAPKLIIGSMPIDQRLGLNIGLSCQVNVSPRMPSFDSSWILSVRIFNRVVEPASVASRSPPVA
jgi:hypothetical protein